MGQEPSTTSYTGSRQGRRRGPSVGAVAEFLEYLSPSALSSPDVPWGLQIGDPGVTVRTAVVAPMATFNAVSTAAARPGSLLITAAPLLTQPLPTIRWDDPVGERIAHLIERRVNLYALPTSIAAAPGGLDDSLAESLGLAGTSMLRATAYETLYKIAVYTPVDAADAVMHAAAEAGAGHIGKYSHCSFQVRGTGTFLPREGAQPAIGSVGQLERVEELRIEMVVQQRELEGVIAAVLHAHPYEEVAYDVYALKNPGTPYGRGRVGDLPLQVSLDTVLSQVQDALPSSAIRCSHRTHMPVGRLAVVSGACDDLIAAASSAGAGALVVGLATPKDWMIAENSATVLIEVGYAASVVPGLQRLCTQIRKTFGPEGMEVICCT